MDEDFKNEFRTIVDKLQCIVERPTPPPGDVRTPFKSIQAWLSFHCENEQRSEPVSEYVLHFEKELLLVNLTGYIHKVEQGINTSRIVFQPKQYTWFKLPKKIYNRLTKEQFINMVHADLIEFFTTDKFKNSFLAKGYNISTNFQEDIWSL